MNTEILERVAIWLEAGAPHAEAEGTAFNMQYDFIETDNLRSRNVEFDGRLAEQLNTDCGSIACIAGAIVQFTDGLETVLTMRERYHGNGIFRRAEEIVGAERLSLEDLFFPENLIDEESQRTGYDATPEEAAKVVRHFIKTGKIDWKVAGFTRMYDDEGPYPDTKLY